MGDSRVFVGSGRKSARSGAGIVSRIRLENFMCHSSLEISFGDWVNFITGQNGSGKSAILTALCIAFGSRARGTQRASTLKDFIKTGCSYATVLVEIKNYGEDAFKHESYGDLITIERRITESSSSITIKDHQGKKVSNRKDELRELVEHFNIDVENPCVIMSQDKSREFLHSGNDKDKFKFFFKATLLQQVSELLQNIMNELTAANAIVEELESSIRPIVKELDELRNKIRSMEHVEEIAQEVQTLKKKLAWSWVYDVDREIQEQSAKLEILKERIPTCQARIDKYTTMVDELNEILKSKKTDIAHLMEKTSEARRMKDELQNSLSVATKERLELEGEHSRETNMVRNLTKRVKLLEQQINDIQEQHTRNTQAEVSKIEEHIKKLQDEVDIAHTSLKRHQEEESAISERLSHAKNAINDMSKEIDENERRCRQLYAQICELQQRQTNKVTAFGGEKVLRLLQSVERHHNKFNRPPIGPVGAHVTLVNGDIWAFAVDCAIGRLLDAFIVTNHKDSLLLRACSREANYNNLQIIIYDFSRPRLHIPQNSLPATNHPTTLAVLHTENPTVFNVLVDMGSAERQVLVQDYEVGKSVAFDQRIPNMKEVYTSDGYRMFYRASVQTTLPPHRRDRTGRLCCAVDDEINLLQNEASKVKEQIQECRGRKRLSEEALRDLEEKCLSAKKRRLNEDRILTSKQIRLQGMKDAYAAEQNAGSEPNVDELFKEISQLKGDIERKEMILEKIAVKMTTIEERAKDLKVSFKDLCDSAKEDIDAIEKAEGKLLLIEEKIQTAEAERVHYEGVMQKKVLPDIKEAETAYETLQQKRQENFRKASIICPECEMESLGDFAGSTPEQLSAQLSRLKQRLQHESQRYTESIDDLRALYHKKERKIMKKQQTYTLFREKLNACQKALDLRWSKFQRNATLLKRQLTWQFNGHLRKKGISGQIKVDYEKKVLSVEVKMPQDASGKTVRDTRGLSGGERSFSTLCFALALHEMTESPFRAMDEFDVFMDAVSRKISLETLVDFAVTQGSQWIFITPHDISMVKPGERVKKQQMAAPRG
ncbi:structural maintenance of chromosomes protein 6B-like [Canna indica]|uniref:Structural maintenance of chromosomes protein 6B-like n=1 Tax=Canna indica TaxID=4628 RepID=A0AAQ3KCY0_9LILI|nr:structural maintenance of chromosomes protein 6B-like [Canna indica]